MVDGRYCFPPDENMEDNVGWLVAIGDTPKEALDKIKEYSESLPEGLVADVTPLADVLKEIETAKNEGMPFTDQTLPHPQSVIST